ncbi:MAG: D-alanyl-D-alanine carboxypeptidase [Bacilli bacterium]|nr:D-alanyl-D-alanine carboxypeptidase [Bacilli bacterium]MDD4643843.1 D-alanyl-D-alanine carboxypeptidase [Bacilli bacterium]
MKKILLCILAFIMLCPLIKAEEIKLAPNAKSVLLMEASTGEIIYGRDIHIKYAPASMTKMMSMLLYLEAIDRGQMSWDEKIKVSVNASSMGGSQILLETGEIMSVTDLFKGVAIGSGNDASVALAERVGGTEAHFVQMMNNRAKELGLKNSNFKNSHGLDIANHYSTAYDMALIARELVKYDKLLEYTSIYETYLRANTDRKFWLVNTNKLVRFYQGVDGIKTGYTNEAGHCLTATAQKDGMRLIAVVFGEPDGTIRNNEVSAMLDYGFNVYGLERVLSNESNLGTVNVAGGKKRTVTIVPTEDVNILYQKSVGKKNITYKVKVDKLSAPIKRGDIVGSIDILDNDKIIRNINVTVSEDIKKANILELYIRHLGDIIKGLS